MRQLCLKALPNLRFLGIFRENHRSGSSSPHDDLMEAIYPCSNERFL